MHRFLLPIALLLPLLVACADKRPSIGIESASPAYDAVLERGSTVRLRMVVSFSQPRREGTVRLFVQNGSTVLGKDTATVFGEIGTAVVETTFVAPSSGDVTVRVALFAPGEKESTEIDRFEYRLRDAADVR